MTRGVKLFIALAIAAALATAIFGAAVAVTR